MDCYVLNGVEMTLVVDGPAVCRQPCSSIFHKWTQTHAIPSTILEYTYAYIDYPNHPNVGTYVIHGWSGIGFMSPGFWGRHRCSPQYWAHSIGSNTTQYCGCHYDTPNGKIHTLIHTLTLVFS